MTCAKIFGDTLFTTGNTNLLSSFALVDNILHKQAGGVYHLPTADGPPPYCHITHARTHDQHPPVSAATSFHSDATSINTCVSASGYSSISTGYSSWTRRAPFRWDGLGPIRGYHHPRQGPVLHFASLLKVPKLNRTLNGSMRCSSLSMNFLRSRQSQTKGVSGSSAESLLNSTGWQETSE